MSHRTPPKISLDRNHQPKRGYYKVGADGFRFDNGQVAFGNHEEARNAKERRNKKSNPNLF